MRPEDFDAIYGKGMHQFVQSLINTLAPTTRRDDWWATEGPYEIIAKHLSFPVSDAAMRKPEEHAKNERMATFLDAVAGHQVR